MSIISFHWRLHPYRIQSTEPSPGVGKYNTVQWLENTTEFYWAPFLVETASLCSQKPRIFWKIENQEGMLLYKKVII